MDKKSAALSEKKHIQKIRRLLASAYGHREWKPRLDPVIASFNVTYTPFFKI